MTGQRHKGIYLLPNLLTTASLFAGFLGMLWAINRDFFWSALCILISCVCDGLDGKVARMTKASSNFGVQLDSLADLVAFGVTPALLVYLWQIHVFGRLGIACAFFYLACGALRLARFNVMSMTGNGQPSKFFVGLPIPAAACVLATLVLFATYLPLSVQAVFLPRFCLVITFVLAFLMVSKIRYLAFKDAELIKAHPFRVSLAVVLLFVLIASEPKMFGFLFFALYLLSGPLYTYFLLPVQKKTFLRGLSRHKPS